MYLRTQSSCTNDIVLVIRHSISVIYLMNIFHTCTYDSSTVFKVALIYKGSLFKVIRISFWGFENLHALPILDIWYDDYHMVCELLFSRLCHTVLETRLNLAILPIQNYQSRHNILDYFVELTACDNGTKLWKSISNISNICSQERYFKILINILDTGSELSFEGSSRF